MGNGALPHGPSDRAHPRLYHPSRGNGREGLPVTARKRTLALSRSRSASSGSLKLEQEIDSLRRTEEAIIGRHRCGTRARRSGTCRPVKRRRALPFVPWSFGT
jgi:hypothetical protein